MRIEPMLHNSDLGASMDCLRLAQVPSSRAKLGDDVPNPIKLDGARAPTFDAIHPYNETWICYLNCRFTPVIDKR